MLSKITQQVSNSISLRTVVATFCSNAGPFVILGRVVLNSYLLFKVLKLIFSRSF